MTSHFFDRVRNFHGRPDYRRYHGHWPPQTNGRQLRGEASPTYMPHPAVPARIAEYNPDIKLIFILRDPADRAYSHYKMLLRLRKETRDFRGALERGLRSRNRKRHYLQRGLYAEQIENFAEHFPWRQMLFLKNEDLLSSQRATLARCCRFLGVPRFNFGPPPAVAVHSYEPMRPADRRHLVNFYAPDIRRLERMLGWDCSDWYSKKVR
jgi:hypothetical protein